MNTSIVSRINYINLQKPFIQLPFLKLLEIGLVTDFSCF